MNSVSDVAELNLKCRVCKGGKMVRKYNQPYKFFFTECVKCGYKSKDPIIAQDKCGNG